MIEANANLGILLDSKFDEILRAIDKSARVEGGTPRILRLPVGLTADRQYALLGGPAQGRQWHVRRAHFSGAGTAISFPVTMYSDESLSASSALWEFDEAPAQETWSREEMVLFHPDVLVVTAGSAGSVLAGHVQVVDQFVYGVRNEPSEA